MMTTERQEAMLRYIAHFIGSRGYSPTIREIGDGVGVTSTSVISKNLDRLEKLGYLTRKENISRSIVLADDMRVQVMMEGSS